MNSVESTKMMIEEFGLLIRNGETTVDCIIDTIRMYDDTKKDKLLSRWCLSDLFAIKPYPKDSVEWELQFALIKYYVEEQSCLEEDEEEKTVEEHREIIIDQLISSTASYIRNYNKSPYEFIEILKETSWKEATKEIAPTLNILYRLNYDDDDIKNIIKYEYIKYLEGLL